MKAYALSPLQFRNQYDNDVTIWSPQVKHLHVYYCGNVTAYCACVGAYSPDRVCNGSCEAGECLQQVGEGRAGEGR